MLHNKHLRAAAFAPGPHVSGRFESSVVRKMAADPTPSVKKAEFIDTVATKTGLSKADVGEVLSATLETIVETVAEGKKVNFLGFGTFSFTDRKARMGRNPKTGESLEIKASRAPTFSSSKAFKTRLNPDRS
jgi:DNA-binding protein HU-beta